jgi:hypothetical protein
MNSLQHQSLTLDALDALDFVVCGDLQGLAELAGRNNPNARLSEPNRSNRRKPKKFRSMSLLQRLRPLFCDPA